MVAFLRRCLKFCWDKKFFWIASDWYLLKLICTYAPRHDKAIMWFIVLRFDAPLFGMIWVEGFWSFPILVFFWLFCKQLTLCMTSFDIFLILLVSTSIFFSTLRTTWVVIILFLCTLGTCHRIFDIEWVLLLLDWI